MTEKFAICAGSFDPPTLGHLWVFERGSQLFDKLIIAVGTNPEKKYTFSLYDRKKLLEKTTEHLPNVEIDEFPDTFLTDYAKSKDAAFILRGIRNESNYLYEREMRYTNSDFAPEITTVFLIPPRELAQVSSSFVKNLVGPRHWQNKIERYVPQAVYLALMAGFHGYDD